MDRRKALLVLLSGLVSIASFAQKELEYTDGDVKTETGARLGAAVEYSLIPRTLDLTLEERIYIDDDFSHLKRSYTTLGVDYKLLPWLKAGLGYSFIANNSSSWEIRHRVAFYLTESFKYDRWKFSFREKIQMTHLDDVNIYQDPRNALALKLRAKVSYDLPSSHFSPFFSAEPRFAINGVDPGEFVYETEKGRWTNPNPSYTHFFFNRLRLNLGTSYKTRRKNTIDCFIVADLNYDLDIDFNAKGNQKKDDVTGQYEPYLINQDSYFIGLGLKYNFKWR